MHGCRACARRFYTGPVDGNGRVVDVLSAVLAHRTTFGLGGVVMIPSVFNKVAFYHFNSDRDSIATDADKG